ncbi:MAG: hypothetical protein U9Q30_04825 [Campylobacterota bacterium]|nr:hypothetical protein [Campylobacterota bacterium]
MKYKISAKTFNGIEIKPEIELFVTLGERNTILPVGIYNKVLSNIQEDISFNVVSRDLENLKYQNIKVDYNSLIEVITKMILELIPDTQDRIKNPKLLRSIELYEDANIEQSKLLFDEIDNTTLKKFDLDEYFLLSFKLLKEKTKDDFNEARNLFKENPNKIKQIYFTYIKYLQNIRDEKEPKKLINEFEAKYPISILERDELSFYYYLKGRGEYARGEFLLALKNLSLAIENTDKEDEKQLATIYNSATNSFTDNLFFDEAQQLASKALELRDKLKLAETKDSLSLIGGIYFKSGKFKKAYEQFKKVDINDSRSFNYLAKCSIMLDYNHKANEYLEQSKTFQDDKKGFLVLYKFLLLFKEKQFDEVLELYKQTIMLPENKKSYDKFVLGWGFTLVARAYFEEKEYSNGVHNLFIGIDFFVEDRYILEAFYVSLYIYQYSLPINDIDRFYSLIDRYNLKQKFEEYVQKHKNISKEYSDIFGIKKGETNNLKKFYKDTKEINQENYNPDVVKDILDKFCLI